MHNIPGMHRQDWERSVKRQMWSSIGSLSKTPIALVEKDLSGKLQGLEGRKSRGGPTARVGLRRGGQLDPPHQLWVWVANSDVSSPDGSWRSSGRPNVVHYFWHSGWRVGVSRHYKTVKKLLVLPWCSLQELDSGHIAESSLQSHVYRQNTSLWPKVVALTTVLLNVHSSLP